MITDKQLASLYDTLTRKGIEEFDDLGGEVLYHPEREKHTALFIKGSENSKVLAVGHCDVVQSAWCEPKISIDRSRIECGQLDDRLGVWLITKVLKTILPKELPYDILLTTGEESGDSTASLFTRDNHQYNWMFEWDRKSTEVVMYSYETKELKSLLQDYKFKVGFGSFTDICYLNRLNCAGFNFGTGYYGEHSKSCYALLVETIENVEKFIPFYKDQYHNHLLGDQQAANNRMDNKNTSTIYTPHKGYAKSEDNDFFRNNKDIPITTERDWDGDIYIGETNVSEEELAKYLDPLYASENYEGGKKNRQLVTINRQVFYEAMPIGDTDEWCATVYTKHGTTEHILYLSTKVYTSCVRAENAACQWCRQHKIKKPKLHKWRSGS